MAELSTLLGFFESKRKRNYSPIKQIPIPRYIKMEELSTLTTGLRGNIIINLINYETI